jgi:hypothetical protein
VEQALERGADVSDATLVTQRSSGSNGRSSRDLAGVIGGISGGAASLLVLVLALAYLIVRRNLRRLKKV